MARRRRDPEFVTLMNGKTVQLLGYRGFAELASEIRVADGGGPITAKALRNYAWKDKVRGYPHLLPQPVALGEDGLPLWLPSQVPDWIRDRQGVGNRTVGEARRRTQQNVA